MCCSSIYIWIRLATIFFFFLKSLQSLTYSIYSKAFNRHMVKSGQYQTKSIQQEWEIHFFFFSFFCCFCFPHKFHLCHFSCSVKCTRDKENEDSSFSSAPVPACPTHLRLSRPGRTPATWRSRLPRYAPLLRRPPCAPTGRIPGSGGRAHAGMEPAAGWRSSGRHGRAPAMPPFGERRECGGPEGGEEKALRGVSGKGVGVGPAGGGGNGF